MRPSDLFFGDGTDDFRDVNDPRSPESIHSVPDHSRSCRAHLTGFGRMHYGRTDRPTDGRTKPHIEMQGRI